MSDEAMVAEFDTFATWTADAVVELGPDHALPAACRGSGSPAGLDWLVDRLGLARGDRLLDSGAGLGGAAEYAATVHGVVPTLAEPMEGACHDAARLFGHRVAVADGAALPFSAGSFDAAWSLGVLSTVEDTSTHLAELARVVGVGGVVGLLVFVRTVDRLAEQPEGNTFPDRAELDAAVRRSGLEIVDEVLMDALAAPPDSWGRAVAEVVAVIERDHGEEKGFAVAQHQSDQMGRLVADGLIVPQLLACEIKHVT